LINIYVRLFWKTEKKYYICRNNQNDNIMKTIEVTLQEIWQATRPIVQKSKRDYTRKQKHKNKNI
jgi:hypothetical protein